MIVLAGRSAWAERVIPLLPDSQIVRRENPRELSIGWLIETLPTLILLDGDDAEWRSWIAALKVEQATRRTPILVIASDPALETTAFGAGADGFLLNSDLETLLASQVRLLARQMTPEQLEALSCACADDLPPRAREAVEQFNLGEYYHQHDLFEAEWMAETGPVRELYRAVLQVGVAYYHITRGNYFGALRVLQRSVQWLALLPDVCQGIDVAQLREDAARVRSALETMDSGDSFDPRLLRPIRLIEH